MEAATRPASARRHGVSPVQGALATLAVLGAVAVAAFVLGISHGYRSVTPADLASSHPAGKVRLVGYLAVAPSRRNGSLELVLTDAARTARVVVRYAAATDDPLRVGEQVTVTGRQDGGVFVADPDSLVGSCAASGRPEHC